MRKHKPINKTANIPTARSTFCINGNI